MFSQIFIGCHPFTDNRPGIQPVIPDILTVQRQQFGEQPHFGSDFFDDPQPIEQRAFNFIDHLHRCLLSSSVHNRDGWRSLTGAPSESPGLKPSPGLSATVSHCQSPCKRRQSLRRRASPDGYRLWISKYRTVFSGEPSTPMVNRHWSPFSSHA